MEKVVGFFWEKEPQRLLDADYPVRKTRHQLMYCTILHVSINHQQLSYYILKYILKWAAHEIAGTHSIGNLNNQWWQSDTLLLKCIAIGWWIRLLHQNIPILKKVLLQVLATYVPLSMLRVRLCDFGAYISIQSFEDSDSVENLSRNTAAYTCISWRMNDASASLTTRHHDVCMTYQCAFSGCSC